MTQTFGERERILKDAAMDHIPMLINLLNVQIAENHTLRMRRIQTVRDAIRHIASIMGMSTQGQPNSMQSDVSVGCLSKRLTAEGQRSRASSYALRIAPDLRVGQLGTFVTAVYQLHV